MKTFLLPIYLLIVSAFIPLRTESSRSLLQNTPPSPSGPYFDDTTIRCESWRLTVETNNAGDWKVFPYECEKFVENYMGDQFYLMDIEAVANCSLDFAKTVNLVGDGKDAWVFDVDETLLSTLPYFDLYGYRFVDKADFEIWANLSQGVCLEGSLEAYQKIQEKGFKVFLISERPEHLRSATEKNLLEATYNNWERLIMRGHEDKDKSMIQFKSEKRQELVNQGYRLHGATGDQWSDLLGPAAATRSFKLPNILYHDILYN